jgi:ankyrin
VSSEQDGFGPLHFAAKCGCKEIVTLLLDKGCDIGGKTQVLHCQSAPLGHTLSSQMLCHILILEIIQNGSSPLHLAINEERRDIVSLLLDRGADVHMKGQV